MTVIQSACRHLWRKRTRSLLTVTGIFIGVALVALVSVIGKAGRTMVNTELENMGLGGLSVTASGDTPLVQDSLSALRNMSSVTSAVPLMLNTCHAANANGEALSLMLCGIDSGEIQAIGLTQCYGRMLSSSDVRGAARVCVVDTAVAKELFATENVVGRTVTVPLGGMDEEFTVVGVTQAGSALLQNVSQWIPGMVYIPYTTMQEITGRDDFDQFAVRLCDGADEAIESQRIERTLRALPGGGEYHAENLSAQRDKLSGLMDIVTMVLTVISGVSLLVAGLSIMTIMTVSVGERTREIGIKKALGASEGRILREFLAEALVLSLLGGVAGVVLGGGAALLGLWLFSLPIPSMTSIGGLVVFAAVLGVVFGVIPAAKAARLDPVDALRCE